METASPGPRKIRINPFSSSSSTFSSRAEGRAGAEGGTFSGSGARLEAPMAVDSLKDQCLPAGSLTSSLEAPAGLFWGLGGLPPRLTRRVSNSLRAWLSCFSSSAILAMDSFSASRSRSVSCGTSTW
uniref:Uncharacterized protein n=1 Tax=Microcebus murinus TaxID=30608 RepID=A0A8C5VLI7_MICMU